METMEVQGGEVNDLLNRDRRLRAQLVKAGVQFVQALGVQGGVQLVGGWRW